MDSWSGSCDEIIVGRKKDVKFLFGFTTGGDLILLNCGNLSVQPQYDDHDGHDHHRTHYHHYIRAFASTNNGL